VIHGEFAVAPLKPLLALIAGDDTSVIHGEFAVAPLKPPDRPGGSGARRGHPRRIRRGPIEAQRSTLRKRRTGSDVIHGEFAVAPLKPGSRPAVPASAPVIHGEFAVAPLKLTQSFCLPQLLEPS